MSTKPPAADGSQSAAAAGRRGPSARRLLRKPTSVGMSSLALFGLVVVAALTPVPYLLQLPGPVVNTLEPYEGQDLITISGTETYEADGKLDMLTVAVAGGPGRSVFTANVLSSLLRTSETVVPSEAFYPLQTTRDDVTDLNSAEMTSSQDDATAAALTELGIDFDVVVEVRDVAGGAAAQGLLEPGDRLLSVAGEEIAGSAEGMASVREAVVSSDGAVEIVVERGGESVAFEVEPDRSSEQPSIGVVMGLAYAFPFDVDFAVDGIGGPSAGTVFALTIIDLLTEGNLTGGEPIAGTGAITAEGEVSAIGGARQKVVAAREAGAEYFLSPAGNCAEVLSAPGADELTVVRVDDLRGARTAVEDIADGTTDQLPACSAGGTD